MGRIAAIDYGLKRIGLALSDANKKIALPLTCVEGGKKAVQNVSKSLPLLEIELILVGMPLLMNGKKGEMAALVEAFSKSLEDAVHLPILLWDERLSSAQASREIPLNRKRKTAKLDMVAATLILQTYLDRMN